MRIIISPQQPDGVNVTIEHLVLDTYEQVLEVIKLCEAITQSQKIDVVKIANEMPRL